MTSKLNPLALPTAILNSHTGELSLKATVVEETLQAQGIPHNGHERVDAFLPTTDGTPWSPVALEYKFSFGTGGHGPLDRYEATTHIDMSNQAAVSALKENGVAFLLTLDSGAQIWGQGFGQNTPVMG